MPLNSTEIRQLRKRLKMTQEQMASSLGVEPITILRWEKGKRKPSQLAQRALARLARKDGGGNH